jgi:hypothetical protein
MAKACPSSLSPFLSSLEISNCPCHWGSRSLALPALRVPGPNPFFGHLPLPSTSLFLATSGSGRRRETCVSQAAGTGWFCP